MQNQKLKFIFLFLLIIFLVDIVDSKVSKRKKSKMSAQANNRQSNPNEYGVFAETLRAKIKVNSSKLPIPSFLSL